MSDLFTNEGKIICPGCKEEQDVLSYVPLKNKLPYETAQILKCRKCRFVFAPLNSVVKYVIQEKN